MTVWLVAVQALPIDAVLSVVTGAVASTLKPVGALVPTLPAASVCPACAEYEPVTSGLPFVDHAPALHGVVSVAEAAPVSVTLTLPSAVVHVPE